ncbi:allantoicase-like [Pocillopora damicornis]|uniref:allantoicase-like n=1 Tax=Pocillopora damicornis TaxID=46731 RepID=UPI000F54F344|nr:allantoicase-like [Pocillopora damicornis]
MAQRGEKKSREATPTFVDLNDLACSRVGGEIMFATDDWFAVAENVLKLAPPEWREGVFTSYGKWMDGWETRRKRIPGHDWCIIKLGIPGVIHGLDIDTSYFTGNYPPKASIQAACLESDSVIFPQRKSIMGSAACTDWVRKVAQLTQEWTYILPMTKLQPGYPSTAHNFFNINNSQRWTHLRLNIYPDGGVARLRVYGKAVKDWNHLDKNKVPVDLAAMENGGMVVGWSDMHFGHPRNLIAPGLAANMGEGWETARRLDRPSIIEVGEDGCLKVPGCEWAVIQLGHQGILKKIEIDTNHFKGNFPHSCVVEGVFVPYLKRLDASTDDWSSLKWKTILPTSKLSPHKGHFFSKLEECGVVSHVRLTIYPDGGISRLRCWGLPDLSSKSSL